MVSKKPVLMKPVIEKVFSQIDFSFSTEYVEVNNFSSKWHYHEKVEIILIIDTTGTGYVGESIVPFSGDTLSIIGSGVPHAWLNDYRYSKKNSSLLAKAIVLKFEENFLGDKFLSLPGMKSIVDLLQIHSKRGMFIEGNDKGEIKKFLVKIMETSNDLTVLSMISITCGRMVSCDLSWWRPKVLISLPSILMLPPAASMIRNRLKVRDDFPAPVRPTIPTW